MHNSKLFNLLKVLSKKELSRLSLFLKSPYHNNTAILVKLYSYIARYFGKYSTSKLSKITVFKHLFPNKEYDDLKMRRLMSSLTGLIEKFLIFEELELGANKMYRNKLFIKSLGKKEDYHRFENEIETQIKRKKAVKFKSIEDYADLTWLFSELYFHPNTKTFTTKNIASILDNLMDSQDRYISFSKLLYSVELQTRHRILNEDHSINFFQEAIDVSKKYTDEASRFDILRALIIPAGDHRQHLEAINSYTDFFLSFYAGKSKNIPESDFLLNGLINFYKSFDGDCSSILFKLCRFGIDEGILIENNTIRGILFSNISILGSSLGEFDWTMNFLENYSTYLNPREKESILNLSYAFFHFHFGLQNNAPKHFLSAQRSIAQIPNHFKENDLRFRSLQLRLYYEFEVKHKENISILLDNAKAFQAFLHRNTELSTGTKEAYSNLIKLLIQLAKVRIETDKNKAESKLDTLNRKIQTTKNIALSNWLLEASSRGKDQIQENQEILT